MLRELLTQRLQRIRTNPNSAELARGTAISFFFRFASVGLLFGSQVLLTRLLGKKEYGFAIYVFTWIQFVALYSNLGFQGASLRFVSSYRAKENFRALWGYIRHTRRITFLLQIAIVLLAEGAFYLFRGRMEPHLYKSFAIMAPGLILINGIILRSSILRGYRSVLRSQIGLQVIRPFFIIVLVAGFWYWNQKTIDAPNYGVLFLIANLITFGFVLVFQRQLVRDLNQRTPDYSERRVWYEVAISMMLISGFIQSGKRIGILLLGIFATTSTAGELAVVSRITDFVSFGLISLNVIAAPMISQLFVEGKMKELQRVLGLASISVHLLTLPIAIGVILFGKFVLNIFGPEFVPAYPALVVLTISATISSLVGPTGNLMSMTRFHRESIFIVGSSSAVNILMNILLIPRFGLLGSAFATLTSTIIWNGAMIIFIARKLHLDPTLFYFFSRWLKKRRETE